MIKRNAGSALWGRERNFAFLGTPERISLGHPVTTAVTKMIRIGTHGWEHVKWQGRFYPDDLPAQWRLGFYANELTAAVVPAADWLPLDAETAAAWLDDTPERFRFYLEWPTGGGAQPSALAASARLLGERLGGFVAESTGAVDGTVAARLAELAPVALIGDPPAAASEYDVCSTDAAGRFTCRGPGRLAVARCPAGAGPKQLRLLLEGLASDGAAESLLWGGEEAGAVETLRQALSVAELMGL